MAKKKPNFLKRSLQLMRRHKAVTILCIVSCLILVLSLGSFVMTRYRDYQNKKIVFQLIDDMKALHTEMEQELGITLDKSYSCTQPSGKSTLETDPLQCHIIIDSTIFMGDATSFLTTKSYLKATKVDTGYTYSYGYRDSGTSCSLVLFDGAVREGFTFSCSLSARQKNKQVIQDELNTY